MVRVRLRNQYALDQPHQNRLRYGVHYGERDNATEERRSDTSVSDVLRFVLRASFDIVQVPLAYDSKDEEWIEDEVSTDRSGKNTRANVICASRAAVADA